MDDTHGGTPRIPDFRSTPTTRRDGFLSPSQPAPVSPTGQVLPPAPPARPKVEVFPWWDLKWENAQAWSTRALNFVVNPTAVANTTTPVPGTFNFQVRPQNSGVIKSLRMTVQNPVATIQLALTLFIGQSPVEGWTGIPFDPVAATAYILVFNDINVLMRQNDILTASFTDTSNPASAWTCSLTASGWQVQNTEIERVQQGFRY